MTFNPKTLMMNLSTIKENIQIGEDGILRLTTLNNYSMPLIRYETSDVAFPIDGSVNLGEAFL